MILGSDSVTGGRGEGSGGGRGGDGPIDSDLESSDSKEEEEDEEEEDTADQNLEWMTQGLLALSDALHRMPKH